MRILSSAYSPGTASSSARQERSTITFGTQKVEVTNRDHFGFKTLVLCMLGFLGYMGMDTLEDIHRELRAGNAAHGVSTKDVMLRQRLEVAINAQLTDEQILTEILPLSLGITREDIEKARVLLVELRETQTIDRDLKEATESVVKSHAKAAEAAAEKAEK